MTDTAQPDAPSAGGSPLPTLAVAPAVSAPPTANTAARGESFLDRVANALADLVEVKVVTIVGDVNVTLRADHDGKTTETVIGDTTITKGAITSIVKVIDGDITTTISPDLLANMDLLAKHEAQLDKSLKVLPDHLKALVEIAKDLKNAF